MRINRFEIRPCGVISARFFYSRTQHNTPQPPKTATSIFQKLGQVTIFLIKKYTGNWIDGIPLKNETISATEHFFFAKKKRAIFSKLRWNFFMRFFKPHLQIEISLFRMFLKVFGRNFRSGELAEVEDTPSDGYIFVNTIEITTENTQIVCEIIAKMMNFDI